MTKPALIDVIKAHLNKEGLVLCRPNDTTFPLDGFKETQALASIVELVEDTQAILEWDEDNTTPMPKELLAQLRASA